jgi:hypothetical protein
MCRKNIFVLWEHCGHKEHRTYDPCRSAPDGIYGGIWSLSCEGQFPDQVFETMKQDWICRACGDEVDESSRDEAAESSRDEAAESSRRGQVQLTRINRVQIEIEELTARTFARLAEETEKGGRA